MEQVRMFLAIALSFLVFFLWNIFFVEKEAPEDQYKKQGQGINQMTDQSPGQDLDQSPGQKSDVTQTTREFKTVDGKPEPFVSEQAGNQAEKMASPERAAENRMAKIFSVHTPLYTVKISEKRAAFTSFVLTNYREHNQPESPLKEMISEENKTGTYVVDFEGNEVPNLSNAVFTCDNISERTEVGDTPRELVFRWRSKEGVEIEKTYTFHPDSYIVDFKVGVKNNGEYPLQNGFSVSLFKKMEEGKKSQYGFTGPSGLINGQLQEVEVDDIEEEGRLKGAITWVAVQGRYFISSLIPKSDKEATMNLFMDSESIVEARYSAPIKPIHPGAERVFGYEIFMGPKSIDVLQEANSDLEKALSFGWFDFISKPCLKLMNFLYGIIPNYGVDIIILTILIKILFWPLGNKSYKSMNEMKRLQPLMAEIREKYKDDKKRMNEEVMKLYKTYKINPLGGCLPMVAQIPVFIAFYQMLYGAIELRHAPFFGWITDLSAPDRLFDFGALGISIPLMEPPYGIPVLTIIMGGTMFIQQKLQPPAGDPTQAKMMMMMPIVFTFIFINFSSGLVLYWLVNNILSIAQQYYVYKKN